MRERKTQAWENHISKDEHNEEELKYYNTLISHKHSRDCFGNRGTTSDLELRDIFDDRQQPHQTKKTKRLNRTRIAIQGVVSDGIQASKVIGVSTHQRVVGYQIKVNASRNI